MQTSGKAACFLAALSLATALSAQVPWYKAPAGPAYQVLVYSFADSDGDGFGDLKGLTSKLDYLNDGKPGGKDLGIQALWLSPIHPSPSYHGYDVLDYMAVDKRLGTIEDFEELCEQAEKRGIKIVMDMVFNHTAMGHPWFANYRGGKAPYDKFYQPKQPGISYGTAGQGSFWEFPKPDGSKGTYFGSFGSGMPDLNVDNTEVILELRAILKFWMEKGADGFRYDAAKHMYDQNERPTGEPILALNRAFFSGLRKYARSIKSDVFFVGEVMSQNPTELGAYGYSLDSVFDFAGAPILLNLARAGTNNNFAESWRKNLGSYKKIKGWYPAPILSNHDQDRSMYQFLVKSGVPGSEGWKVKADDTEQEIAGKKDALRRAKVAASVYLTLPGVPFIYYGEEVGLTGHRYKNNDIDRRVAIPWKDDPKASPGAWWMYEKPNVDQVEPLNMGNTPSVEAQLADPDSLLSHYARLGQARQGIPALGTGSYSVPLIEDADWNDQWILFYGRDTAEQSLLVVHNVGLEKMTLKVPAGMSLIPLWGSRLGMMDKKDALSSGAAFSIDVAQSFVFEIKK